ncbi:ribose-phosphate pyrophosphokinase [Candidatus Microgenomates bacterium]|nr:ribose-phosphate pyrophosphokinase [Candidatus Microgenomates bacterium]
MLLFSGSSNRPLAEKIASELSLSLSPCEVTRFADQEVRVRILTEVKGEHVIVIQSLSTHPDSNLMELGEFGEVLKREKAKKITAVIPYLSYARQHKAHRPGEAVSSKLVANFIKNSGFHEVITVGVHHEEALNFFSIPTLHLSVLEMFAKYVDKHRDDFGGADLIVVAPDMGRKVDAETLAGLLEVESAQIKKIRPLSEKDTIVSCELLGGSVKEKEILIYDDLVSTGSTAITAAQCCLGQGAFHAYLLATHAVLSRGSPAVWQNSPFEKIIVTDTIDIPKEKLFPKLEVISVTPLIAKELRNFV